MSLPRLLTIFTFLFLSFFSVKFSYAYSRIVSLKPNITEILFELGVGESVVGVTTYCTRPEAAKKLPRVADYIRVDTEKVLRLQPDLVIGSKENSSGKEIYFLMDRGHTVRLLSFATIPDTLKSIETLGKILGKEDKARRITHQMEAELSALKKENQGKKRKKALYVVGYQPLIVAGGNNFFDEAGPYIGAFNVAHSSKLKYPNYSHEQLIRSAPEIIFDISEKHEVYGNTFEERKKWWKKFSSIPAVKGGQIYSFDIEKLRAVPSLPQALRELSQLMHSASSPEIRVFPQRDDNKPSN